MNSCEYTYSISNAEESSIYRGETFVTISLSSANVFVTANPQPCSNARRIMADAVVGGAEANPYGFSNFMPQTSTEMSTSSIGL